MKSTQENLGQGKRGRRECVLLTYSIHNRSFPKWDPAMTSEETITLVIQVNGRLRDRMQAPASISEEEVRQMVLASPRVQTHTQGKTVRKLVYVPSRLVNIVAT